MPLPCCQLVQRLALPLSSQRPQEQLSKLQADSLETNWGLSPLFSCFSAMHSGEQVGEQMLILLGSQQGFTTSLELEG